MPSLRGTGVRIALLLVATAGFGSCNKGSDNDPFTYRPTTWYSLETADSDMSGLLLFVMSEGDLSTIVTQTGTPQNAGQGLVWGTVRDGTGAAIAGAQVMALNDAGVSAGTPVYQDTDGSFKTALTATTSRGHFVIQNVAPGRVNLRCVSGASGNAYVEAAADETVLVGLRCLAGGGSVTWSGVTRKLVNLPSTEEPGVTITGIGTGLPFPLTSDGTTGAFNAGSVYRNNTYRVRLSKAGFVDTISAFAVGTANLTTPAGDLLIVSVADRASTSFTPGSVTLDPACGIVRGSLTPSSGSSDGYAVSCTDSDGDPVGTVRYGKAADASPDDALTATTASGVFYVYNVPPGPVLLRAVKAGYGGSCLVEVAADSIRIVDGELSPASNHNDSVVVSGQLATFWGYGVAEGSIRLLGWPTGAVSAADYGYSLAGVPAHHRFAVRCWK